MNGSVIQASAGTLALIPAAHLQPCQIGNDIAESARAVELAGMPVECRLRKTRGQLCTGGWLGLLLLYNRVAIALGSSICCLTSCHNQDHCFCLIERPSVVVSLQTDMDPSLLYAKMDIQVPIKKLGRLLQDAREGHAVEAKG